MWKKTIKKLEELKEWDTAIELLQKILNEHPDSMDAYLSMNYLLMNLLVEEEHPKSFKHELYESLLKYYYGKSYKKFAHAPEYLFYTALTAVMSEWYLGYRF